MKQSYTFIGEGTLEFDSRKSVKELLAYAFEEFSYFEPMGMECVTLFQCHHPDSKTGWFTLDVNAKCGKEIKNPRELCFAYHKPNAFYFAEGGWGQLMTELGNHPHIDNPVPLHLCFEDFDNTVVINGRFSLRDVVRGLLETGYLSAAARALVIRPTDPSAASVRISVADTVLDSDLLMFSSRLPDPLAAIWIE